MDDNISSNKELIHSPLPWDQGDKEKEEIPSESGETKEEGTGKEQNDVELSTGDGGGRDNQQQQSGQCVQSKELQHDRCRFCELESNRQFWEFIEQQESIWNRLYDSKERKSKLKKKQKKYKDDIFIIDFFLTPPIPPMMKGKKRNKKKHMKKKWFRKKKQRRDVTF